MMTKTRRNRKEKVQEFYQAHKVCVLVSVILFALWMVIAIYMKYAPFGKNSMLFNDAIHQYYPLFGQYRDRMLSGKGIFYSTGGGLGFNFYALWTYYLSSPLNIVLVFFPASEIDSAMNLLIIFKIMLSGAAFAFYLGTRFQKERCTMIPFALGYALSTFVLGYSYNIMWVDCLVLFPIVLSGMEKLIKEGKWKQYTISLALCLWCSFYIGFIICLFLALWFLLYEHGSVKAFFKRGIQFASCSVLGAALACIVLVPAYLGIVQTQTASSFPAFDWMDEFAEVFTGKEGGIFVFSDPMSLNNEEAYRVNLYCGVFVLGLAVLYFLAKDIRLLTKVKMAWLLVLFVLSFNNQWLNYVWHGFHYQVGIPNRFAFLMIFVLLLMAYEAFIHLPDCPAWKVVCAGIVPVLIYGGLYWLKKEHVTTVMVACSVSFAFFYMVLWLFYRQQNQQEKFFKGLLLVLMSLELCANAIAGNKANVGVTADVFYREKADLQKMAGTLSGEAYRTELSNPTVKNEGMAYDLAGAGIFSSMVNSNTAMLLHNIGFSTSSNAYTPAGSTPVLNALFGIKQYLILNGDSNRLDPEYKKTDTIGNVTAYENENVLPIAYLCRDEVMDWSAMNSNFFVNQMELLKLMTGTDYEVFTEQEYELTDANDIELTTLDGKQQYTYLSAKGSRNDHAVFTAEAAKDEDLYLRIQASYTNKVSVYVNDTLLAYKDLRSSFYHVGEVKKGDSIRIEMGILENSPTYGKISMSMYAYHPKEMEAAYEDLAAGELHVTDWKEGHITGRVKVGKERQTLFTTIPYDRGWRVRIDGKQAELKTVQGGFIAVPLKEGEHTVELRYQVPGLIAGALATAAGIAVFTAVVCFSKRKKKRAASMAVGETYESEKDNI